MDDHGLTTCAKAKSIVLVSVSKRHPFKWICIWQSGSPVLKQKPVGYSSKAKATHKTMGSFLPPLNKTGCFTLSLYMTLWYLLCTIYPIILVSLHTSSQPNITCFKFNLRIHILPSLPFLLSIHIFDFASATFSLSKSWRLITSTLPLPSYWLGELMGSYLLTRLSLS